MLKLHGGRNDARVSLFFNDKQRLVLPVLLFRSKHDDHVGYRPVWRLVEDARHVDSLLRKYQARRKSGGQPAPGAVPSGGKRRGRDKQSA